MLFKYLPTDRVDVLENLKIRFSPLISLNETFECQPLVDIKDERDQFLDKSLRELDKFWKNTDNEEKTEKKECF